MYIVDYDESPKVGQFKLLDKCLEMIIYLVTDIRRKFDMLVHTKEALEAGQQQGDTLKSSITDCFVRLL